MSLMLMICRAIIAGAFWIATRLSNEIKISGRQYDNGAARTYLGMTHKRDLDPMVLIPTLVFHHGWRRLRGELRFALRGDGFSPGYLGRIVMQPRWLSRLLRVLAIGPVLRWLGAYSVEALLRPGEEWIREALQNGGDRPAREVIAPFLLEALANTSGESYEQIADARLSHLLSWQYHLPLQHFYGAEAIIGAVRRPIQQRHVTRIKSELAELDEWLWGGGSLYSSPEGHLTPNGRFSSINAAFHRLMRAAPPDTRVVPIVLIYDFMTTQRLRIFIDFAPAIEHTPALPLDKLDAALLTAWRRYARFTCTQLASGFLRQASQEGLTAFSLDDLAKNIHVQANRLALEGRLVDARLLSLRGARKRARSYLAYAERRLLVQKDRHGAYLPTVAESPMRLRPREVGYDQAPLAYACNELEDMLAFSFDSVTVMITSPGKRRI
ncbi:MAG TPA: hypothetical protein VGT44_19470 [Ktedonobacteraceae bacterium]|nr:hypothetical protein [Ktedonobacteraceae bacterium]